MRLSLMMTVSVAALVAAGGLASAQGLNERQERPAATAPERIAPDGKANRQTPDAPKASESIKPSPTAQLPEKQTGPKSETVGQGGSTQPAKPSAQPSNERGAPNAAAEAQPTPGTPAALSAEHRAQVRDTIRNQKVAPLTNVQFSVTVGQAVPRTVHLNRLPSRIIEYAPQYRGYEYILVGDEILIVDPRTLRIVAVIPA
ncbi:MAG: DUF1236 domain-containing protein [Rhodoplanes sp.]|uniref:DUF1236 domain-containing protein n=1 Tax=Rhodoplanes sp. TaxID=1968906 RepID=UPI0017EA0D5C|nr:DUF1236 domain-containing protein [Rhodoplanes sp.]NVO16932.1 DUF1236 domain-containing protein [Rhodoplanes sp.]